VTTSSTPTRGGAHRAGPGRLARTPAGVVRRHPIGSHLTLTLLLSWAYWIPLARSGGEGSHVPGLLGPAIAAFVVSAIVDGPAGPRDLGARMVRWRIPRVWWLAALAPLLTGALGVAILAVADPDAVTLGSLSSFPGLPQVGWVGVFVLALVINGYGEEVGWRGFVWPRLRQDHSLAASAGLLALPWAIWHVPTFWLETGMDLHPAVIPGWLVGLAAGAVVLGWLYEHTGSLLLVSLFHASLNMVSGTEIGVLPGAITSALIIVAAVVLLRRDHREEAQS
jgi:uncharacterized protein